MMWDPETLWQMMTCGVILHNMIMEGEEEEAAHTNDFEKAGEHVHLPEQEVEQVLNFLEMHLQVRDQQAHLQLLNDLVIHMWIHIKNQLI